MNSIESGQSDIRSDLLSYQPICDERLAVLGVEMVSRNRQEVAGRQSAPEAAESVSAILNAFIYAGMDELFRSRKVFIKVAQGFLMNEVVYLLPKDRIVMELSPCGPVTPELASRFAGLAAAGFSLALDAWVPNDSRQPLLAHARFIKVRMDDAVAARTATRQLGSCTAKLLASRVDDEERLVLAKALGAELFQGRFFQLPRQITRKPPTVMTQTVLELIAELNSDGSDTRLEEFFKENPALNLQLLHMVNSAATGFSISINSIKQAIAILGRSQMIRWLQIMLYTLDAGVTCPSALMRSALWRAKFMEILGMHYQHKMGSKLEDMAFITGVISLADALLGEPLEEIVGKLKLSASIQTALLHREGALGTMLTVAESLENGDFDRAEAGIHDLKFNVDFVMSTQNAALAWANKISCH